MSRSTSLRYSWVLIVNMWDNKVILNKKAVFPGILICNHLNKFSTYINYCYCNFHINAFVVNIKYLNVLCWLTKLFTMKTESIVKLYSDNDRREEPQTWNQLQWVEWWWWPCAWWRNVTMQNNDYLVAVNVDTQKYMATIQTKDLKKIKITNNNSNLANSNLILIFNQYTCLHVVREELKFVTTRKTYPIIRVLSQVCYV